MTDNKILNMQSKGKLSPYAEMFIGALISFGLGGMIPLVSLRSFVIGSAYFDFDIIIITIGFILCMDGIRRMT